jgi:hypothetical protein
VGAFVTPWPPPLTVIDERTAWTERARRWRRQVNYCQLCERRRVQIGPFELNPKLEVHHRQGRGVRSAVGFEDDAELMTLCCKCHDRITAAHRSLGRQRGQINSRGRTVDPVGYSHTIAEVTAAARPRYWARGWRRTLFGLPNHAVTYPRR